jgi:acetylornithine deacetylase/succinyl-diaminopimelate desuccinylase-like protein
LGTFQNGNKRMTGKPNEVDQYLALAKTYLPDMVSFLQDMVRIPSVNGRQTEQALAQRISAEAERLQLKAHFAAIDPQRPNVLVQYGNGPAGFVLVGHMDTVAEGTPDAWTYPPFEPTLDAGRLLGRGSADNKAGIACGLYTLALLRDHQVLAPENVRLTLAGVVDEESGASSPLGVRHLLNQGLLQPAKGAIYTYAGDIICIGHRGLLRVLLCAAGKSIHTGSPAWSRGEDGVNAVTGLSAILVGLEKLDLPAPAHPAFEGMGCRMTPGTLLKGGEFESMVPAQAEALIDIRLMPGQSVQDVLESIQQVVNFEINRRPGLSVSLEIKNNLPGVALSPDAPLVRTAARWASQVTGRTWPIAGAGPANEGYMLIQAGIPTLCGFGPAGGNAHAPDEWVEIESLAQTVAMYAGIIADTTQPS